MSKDIAIINYGMGNLRSVENAFARVGAAPRIVSAPGEVGAAAGVVLPGVGALRDCIAGLKATGFDDFARGWIREDRPFLGVCLGLQALFERSEEEGAEGLGVFAGPTVRFRSRPGLKIPHMGWNVANLRQPGSRFWEGLEPDDARFYFVHSYHVAPEDPTLALTTTDYDGAFVSAIARGRLVASQFHPERSQANGLRFYANFAARCD